MADNPFVVGSAPLDRRAVVAQTPGVASAARWFWWIAGLSLINTVLVHSGSQTSFVMGLGFTLIVDVAFQSLKVVAFAVDVLAIGFFVGIGWAALRGHLWAFCLGAAVYVLDAGIYLYVQDFMPVAFHALALVYIIRGLVALRGALQAAKARAAASPPVIADEATTASSTAGDTSS